MKNHLQSVNFRRGLLPLIVLQLLQERDMYGYQIVQEAGRRSQGHIITQEGSLYPEKYDFDSLIPIHLSGGECSIDFSRINRALKKRRG